MDSDTMLTLGLVAVGGYAVYKLFGATGKAVTDTASGVGSAVVKTGNVLADVVSGASTSVQTVESGFTKGFNQLSQQLLNLEDWTYNQITGQSNKPSVSTTQGASFSNTGSSTVKAQNFGAIQSTAVATPKLLTASDVLNAARASGNSSIQNLRDTAFTAQGINAAMVH